jgi:hypothetical protein
VTDKERGATPKKSRFAVMKRQPSQEKSGFFFESGRSAMRNSGISGAKSRNSRRKSRFVDERWRMVMKNSRLSRGPRRWFHWKSCLIDEQSLFSEKKRGSTHENSGFSKIEWRWFQRK